MADYSNSKLARYSSYPVKAIDSASMPRVEPIIDSNKFVMRFMFGIPLTSPITGQSLTSEMIEDQITQAMNKVELDLKMDIVPVKRRIRLPFARDLYEEYMYFEVPNKPILSIDKIAITTPDGIDIYRFPPQWIDDANFIEGRINILPLAPASQTMLSQPYQSANTQAGAFMLMVNISPDTPAFWEVECTTGFDIKSTGLPTNINRMIGLQAAISIFNLLIPQFQLSSYALGLDGVSQSQTTQAPQLYAQIRDKYQEEYDSLSNSIRMMYNNKILAGMI